MKMKQIFVFTLFALLMIGCGSSDSEPKQAQAPKDSTEQIQQTQENVSDNILSFTVLKTKIDGFSHRIIEIDQDSIMLDFSKKEVKICFKKVAEFPKNYVPRLVSIQISSIEENYSRIDILPSDYITSPSCHQLSKLLQGPIGGTACVTLRLTAPTSISESERSKIKGLAISAMEIENQEEYDEFFSFYAEFRKQLIANNKSKLKAMSDYHYAKSDDLEFNLFATFDDLFLLEDGILSLVTPEALNKGYVYLKNEIEDYNYQEYCLLEKDITTDGFAIIKSKFLKPDIEDYDAPIVTYRSHFVKIDGMYKYVGFSEEV